MTVSYWPVGWSCDTGWSEQTCVVSWSTQTCYPGTRPCRYCNEIAECVYQATGYNTYQCSNGHTFNVSLNVPHDWHSTEYTVVRRPFSLDKREPR